MTNAQRRRAVKAAAKQPGPKPRKSPGGNRADRRAALSKARTWDRLALKRQLGWEDQQRETDARLARRAKRAARISA